MNVEAHIVLNRFKPREYQLPVCDALENKKYRRIICIMPRRAGKDMVAWNLTIRAALRRVGTYFYVFPTYSQAKKVIWDATTIEGHRFIHYYIPDEIVESMNGQEMKIRLSNGSLIQLVGSDNIDSLVGTNPLGIVFSEYALQTPDAYNFLRPILMANDGWCMFISTPRGKNHLWELFNIGKANPDSWFAYKLTLDDTQHVTKEILEDERRAGMTDDLIDQEYYCSFDRGVEGAFYAKYFDKMRVKGQIGLVPWEPAFKVNTAWDLGMRDNTTVIFFQNIGATVRIIDCYENSNYGLEHYIKVLQSKDYRYGCHIAPHDIKVRELGTGMSRLEKARQLGVSFIVAPDLSVEDGIEAVRSSLSKIWIDEAACKSLIKAMENYRKEWDVKKKVYKDYPLHDWSSHFADCMRYLCISLSKTRDGLTPEDLDKRYQEAVYGNQSNMPAIFRDDLPGY